MARKRLNWQTRSCAVPLWPRFSRIPEESVYTSRKSVFPSILSQPSAASPYLTCPREAGLPQWQESMIASTSMMASTGALTTERCNASTRNAANTQAVLLGPRHRMQPKKGLSGSASHLSGACLNPLSTIKKQNDVHACLSRLEALLLRPA